MSCQPHSLTSLFLGIPSFWHLFLLRPSSLDIFFSRNHILLAWFSVDTIFLVSFCFAFFSLTRLFVVFLEAFCLDTCFGTFFSWHPFSLDFPGAILYYKSLHKDFPALLSTTKACTKTSQNYFVLQGLHKVLAKTTLRYKAPTKHFPIRLRTTRLAQSTSQHSLVLQGLHNYSQYYFVLQDLQKIVPPYNFLLQSSHKHTPVLLPSITSHVHFVLHSLHKVNIYIYIFLSTTSHYKTCTKYFPVVHVSLDSLHTEVFCTQKLLHTEVFTDRSFWHTETFKQRSLYMHSLLRDVFTQRSLYTQKPLYTHGSFQHTGVCNTQKCLHTETLNTQKLLHRKVFTNRSFYTFLHTHTHAFTHKSFDTQKKYMQKHLHTDAFTHRSFRTDRESSTQRSFYTEITAPERDLGAKANPEACLKRIF